MSRGRRKNRERPALFLGPLASRQNFCLTAISSRVHTPRPVVQILRPEFISPSLETSGSALILGVISHIFELWESCGSRMRGRQSQRAREANCHGRSNLNPSNSIATAECGCANLGVRTAFLCDRWKRNAGCDRRRIPPVSCAWKGLWGRRNYPADSSLGRSSWPCHVLVGSPVSGAERLHTKREPSPAYAYRRRWRC